MASTIGYTTLDNVAAFGQRVLAGNDAALVNTFIAEVSRQFDEKTHQSLGDDIYTNQSVCAVVKGRDGALLCYPNVPCIGQITSVQWAIISPTTGIPGTYQTLDPSTAQIKNGKHGAIVTFPAFAFGGLTGNSIVSGTGVVSVLISFRGGYTAIGTTVPGPNVAPVVPPDLEDAAKTLVWWKYRRREMLFNQQTTAQPDLGTLTTTSGGWPAEVLDALKAYAWVLPL